MCNRKVTYQCVHLRTVRSVILIVPSVIVLVYNKNYNHQISYFNVFDGRWSLFIARNHLEIWLDYETTY